VLELGTFRFLDVGDLIGQPLFDLVCPRDRIGAVDVYLVAHHGNAGAADPATLAAFRPRAAVVDNAPPERIANLDPASAHWLKVTARADGSFTVINGRTSAAKDYAAR
jgi:hypothetical protein